MATVEGDIHDIGKNIVTSMLDANGFDVLDLGVDIPVVKIIEAAKEFKPAVVGLSGLLTLAFDPMCWFPF
jgi:methanogenic corrinoid protein MtbC1